MKPAARPSADHPFSALLGQVSPETPYLEALRTHAEALPAPQTIDFLPTPDAIAAQFESWRQADVPSYAVLAGLAPVADNACLMAALLGSLPADLKYHSHHHTREVTYLAMMMAQTLPADAQREIFIASCIHDFAHDGRGNRRGATHTPMRLEQRALDMAHPYMKIAGVSDQSWARISVMVLTTDVSKDDANEKSPAEWLRRALNGESGTGCPSTLAPLFDDKTLALQAGILEDADLGSSAGMPYEHASRMTALIADETGVLAPTPQTLIGFLDHICHGRFLTRNALEVFGDNIPALRSRAVDETADTIYHWS